MARFRAPPDPRGGHVRIYWEIVDSHAWRALSWADRGLYVALRRKLLNTNNGNIEATLGGMSPAGITSSASLSKGLRSLIAVGLIDKTRQGGIAYGSKVCSLYRFTDEAMLDHPRLGLKAMRATNEWKQFGSIEAANTAIEQANQAARRRPSENDLGVRFLKPAASESESHAVTSDSLPEAAGVLRVQRLKQRTPALNRRNAA